MLTPLINTARLTFELCTTSPLLVRSGLPGFGPVEAIPVATLRDGLEEPFIPASTIRGLFRHHLESVLRPLRSDAACLVTEDRGSARCCGRVLEDAEREARSSRRSPLSSSTIYRSSCALCRIFGSTMMASRLKVTDALVVPGSHPVNVRRTSVGIDRFTGAATLRARLDVEAVSDAQFLCEIRLINFETWQLGLLSLALRDLFQGRIPIGSGSARGLGRVEGHLTDIHFQLFTLQGHQGTISAIPGIGSLIPDGSAFGYQHSDQISLERSHVLFSDGLTHSYELTPEEYPWDTLLAAAVRYMREQYSRELPRHSHGESGGF